MSLKRALLKLGMKIYSPPSYVGFVVVVCLVLKGVCGFVLLALEHTKDSNPCKKIRLNPLSEYSQLPNLYHF